MIEEDLLKEVTLKPMDKKTPVNVIEIMVEAYDSRGDRNTHTVIYTQEEFIERVPFFKFMQWSGDVEEAEQYAQENTQYKKLFEECLAEIDPGVIDCDYDAYGVDNIYYVNQRGKYSKIEFKEGFQI